MPLAPTLDHVVINTHRDMDAAADAYRRLGFTLTPRGHHSLGSINHLAIFATDYLELIGLPATGGGRADLLDWPRGLNGLVWGSENADQTASALVAAGVPCLPAQSFTRPVDLPGGPEDAGFRTVRLPNDTTSAGRLYFCQHFTRHLVWRDEWRQHANGTTGVAGAVITATDPSRLAALFAHMFGPSALRPIDGGHRLAVGLIWFDVITPAAATERFGPLPADDRPEAMAVLVLRTRSLAEATAAIQVSDIIREAHRILVPPTAAFGAILAFEE